MVYWSILEEEWSYLHEILAFLDLSPYFTWFYVKSDPHVIGRYTRTRLSYKASEPILESGNRGLQDQIKSNTPFYTLDTKHTLSFTLKLLIFPFFPIFETTLQKESLKMFCRSWKNRPLFVPAPIYTRQHKKCNFIKIWKNFFKFNFIGGTGTGWCNSPSCLHAT